MDCLPQPLPFPLPQPAWTSWGQTRHRSNANAGAPLFLSYLGQTDRLNLESYGWHVTFLSSIWSPLSPNKPTRRFGKRDHVEKVQMGDGKQRRQNFGARPCCWLQIKKKTKASTFPFVFRGPNIPPSTKFTQEKIAKVRPRDSPAWWCTKRLHIQPDFHGQSVNAHVKPRELLDFLPDLELNRIHAFQEGNQATTAKKHADKDNVISIPQMADCISPWNGRTESLLASSLCIFFPAAFFGTEYYAGCYLGKEATDW